MNIERLIMKVQADLDTLFKVWQRTTNHLLPLLYTVTPQGKVNECWPIAGSNYTWDLTDTPFEANFLVVFPFAVKVDNVTP
jgi:hypothetical protein